MGGVDSDDRRRIYSVHRGERRELRVRISEN